MKQLYILALGGLLSFSAQAQFNQPSAAAKEDMAPRYKVTAVQQNADREVFWTNDISTCTDFTFGNGSMEVGQPWTDIDISFFCSTEGPAGLYNQWAGGTGDGSAAPAINSASADNGFLMVDSDLFGAEANYAADWVENCWAQTAEPIDCSAHPYVSIAMQTRYRCWDNGASDGSEKCFIEVSRDGVTWPTLTNAYTTTWADEGMVDYDGTMVQCRYNVFPDSETGFESDNPSLLEFDITEAAGGQSTVWIRFRWVGTWGYSWEIDDLEVYDTPENDTRIDNYLSFSNYSQTGLYEYGAWAQSQIPTDLQAGAKVYNVGYADQTNVMMDLDVNGTAFASNTLDTLGYAVNDTLVMSYQPDGLGTQTLNYLLSADAEDENPGNNSATQSFDVTDLQYGRDNGVVTAAFPGEGTDDYIAMPLYDIINDVTIYGIDVAILDGSEDGTPIRGFLVDMFDDLALTEQYGGELISSAEVDMASGYTNSGDGDIVWYTLALEEPYQAAAGDWIGAAFEHYGGANVQIGEAQYTYDQTAFVYGPFGSGNAYDWYYSNEVPMVRLNLDPAATTTVNVEEVASMQGFELFPAFPNPANDNTRFQFRLDQTSDVTFELRDVTGKLVEVRDMGTQPAGYNSFVLETSALGAGSYTAILTVNDARTTQKLMVK
ncbi:MAG: T9SS type A sorting domain-containing protein [Flavobacteriales bacterium]|nr:T9SS type A sorting domain-containing protein [Flavobacteriales bacterium]